MVTMCKRPAGGIPLREVTQLHRKPARLDGVEPPVISLDIVVILLSLTMVANHLHALGHSLVIRGDCARFATRSKILPRVETECRSFAHGTRTLPGIILLREIFGAMRLASVFNHK